METRRLIRQILSQIYRMTIFENNVFILQNIEEQQL